jgi:hypothetical protein
MQAKKIKIIKVPLEGRKKLAERYGCCREEPSHQVTTTIYYISTIYANN